MTVLEGLVAVKMPSKFDDSIRIKLEDGEWYSAEQSIADQCLKGATIKIKTEQRGKSCFITKVKQTAAPVAGGGGGYKCGGGGGGFKKGGGGGGGSNLSKEEWHEKDLTIQYQSARKDAIEVLKLMQAADVLKLGSKAAEKEGLLLTTLDRLTVGFFEDIEARGAVKRYKGEADESEEFTPEDDADSAGPADDFADDDGDDF